MQIGSAHLPEPVEDAGHGALPTKASASAREGDRKGRTLSADGIRVGLSQRGKEDGHCPQTASEAASARRWRRTLSADCIRDGLSQRGGEETLPQMRPGWPQPDEGRGVRAQDRLKLQPCNASHKVLQKHA